MDVFLIGLALVIVVLIILAALAIFHKKSETEEPESNLVKHARYELKLMGESPEVIDWALRVVREYASFGHSGGSHAMLLPMLFELLDYKNLTDLTDNPAEWIYHSPEMWDGENGVWQNRRNSEAFSIDGGKTYSFVTDGEYHNNPHLHESVHVNLGEVITE